MSNLTLLDLTSFVVWLDVKKALQYYYKAGNNSLCRKLYSELSKYKKRKHSDKDEYIRIRVGGRDFDYDEFYSTATNKYSLSFRGWKEIANIPIESETLAQHKYYEIMAHILWEMTWWGPEAQAKKYAGDLMKKVKEIVKNPTEHTEKYVLPKGKTSSDF